MRIDVVTLFPEMVEPAARFGVTGRALQRGLWRLGVWNPRDYVTDRHRTVDDRPYGGGPGMVMLPEPLEKAVNAARQRQKSSGVRKPRVLHLSPQGRVLDHALVVELAAEQGFVMLAGRYEGIDERLIDRVADDEISIGDYVLSGGELGAMVVIDSVVRQLPGALNDAESASQDSFAEGLLDCPHYTRPEVYEGVAVPPVLLSGNHADIAKWRLKQALGRTYRRRPDLLAKRSLSAAEATLLEEFKKEAE